PDGAPIAVQRIELARRREGARDLREHEVRGLQDVAIVGEVGALVAGDPIPRLAGRVIDIERVDEVADGLQASQQDRALVRELAKLLRLRRNRGALEIAEEVEEVCGALVAYALAQNRLGERLR